MNKFEALDLEDSRNSDSGEEADEEKNEQENSKEKLMKYFHKIEERMYPYVTVTDGTVEIKKITKSIRMIQITLVPLVIGENEHQLQYPYALWFSKRPPGKQQFNYEENIKLVGKFASVEQFWSLYSWLVHPSELTGHCDYHLFKDGIKPMWEDEANQLGGKWIVRLKKGIASRFWENLILAILGEQFMVGDEICGAVISIRFQEDIISVWNRTFSDQAVTTRIRDTLKRVLSLPLNTIMEYKTHNNSIRDNSSFRNTAVFSS